MSEQGIPRFFSVRRDAVASRENVLSKTGSGYFEYGTRRFGFASNARNCLIEKAVHHAEHGFMVRNRSKEVKNRQTGIFGAIQKAAKPTKES